MKAAVAAPEELNFVQNYLSSNPHTKKLIYLYVLCKQNNTIIVMLLEKLKAQRSKDNSILSLYVRSEKEVEWY
jgi:hypothetical protein